MGALTLLLDEDTLATNFMIRDIRMKALIAKEREPITPFVEHVRSLYGKKGVSTVIVMGGSGDYFSLADTVIGMIEYKPHDLTSQAHQIVKENPSPEYVDATPPSGYSTYPLTEYTECFKGEKTCRYKNRGPFVHAFRGTESPGRSNRTTRTSQPVKNDRILPSIMPGDI